ncbi:MAG: DNA alkylation repair protein [Candidatus Thorarchaeota archaeon]
MISDRVKQIHSDLIHHSNPERKEKIAGYLKTSTLKFIGVELPDIHRIVKSNTKGINLDDKIPLMTELWKMDFFETRLAAIDVFKEYAQKGSVEKALELASSWIDDADTWAITDPLCSPCIGGLILRDAKVSKVLESWRTSSNFWRRRCSVLPYLYLTLKTQYKPEFANMILEAVTPHISDEEFFVGKAAGWVLRELSKRDPNLVNEFFRKHHHVMTKLVIREGQKKL